MKATQFSLTLFSSLALTVSSQAGFTWLDANNTTSTYAISGGGIGIMNSVAIGGTSSGGNDSHILQGVDVRYEAYDKAGNALNLTTSDLTFVSSVSGSGQGFTTNLDIDGYIKITYDFALPWVPNQNPSSPWDSFVSGSFNPFGIESKFTFVSNPLDYDFTQAWYNNGTQLDPNLAFLIGDGIIEDSGTNNTIGTGADGTGTGNYMHGTATTAATGIEWHGDFDHDPYANQYDLNEIFIRPTGNATNANGDAIIRAGTQFGFTTNGAVLTPVPEPSGTLLLGMTLGAVALWRRRK